MSADSASSTSADDLQLSPDPTPSQPTSRKVAAALDLFKETVPTSEHDSSVTPASDTKLPESTITGHEEVSGAQFVKRTEWPDRENAAHRRDKSAAAQDRARTRERKGDTDQRRLTGHSLDKADLSRTPSRVRVPPAFVGMFFRHHLLNHVLIYHRFRSR